MIMNKSKIIIFSIFMLIILQIPLNAFGDGFTQENLPPASVGNRDASLFIKISPPILTENTAEDKFLELRLFDAKTGETIKHTSFFVTVDKDGKLLMRDLFHTHTGSLIIKIKSEDLDVNDIVVYGDHEPYLDAWTSVNDNISVKAPILLDAGLYHFEIEIFGIDYDNNIFATSDAPRFDSWLSVGDIFNQKVSTGGKSYDLSITSYYDKINNFNYDETKKSITFSMPFNWDISRLEKQNIFVHQEIHFPTSFKEFSQAGAYKATVNGFPVTGRMLIADPYSLDNTSILHYLLSKQNVLDIAKTLKPGTKTMEFSLSPDNSLKVEKNSFDVNFDTGVFAKIKYDSKLVSDQKIPFEIVFFDKNNNLLKWVTYGYRIEDSSGTTIHESKNMDPNKPGILLTEGIDKPEFDFKSIGKYKMTLAIFSHGLDNLKTFSGLASNSFDVDSGSSVIPPPDNSSGINQIPTWIKNNAGWWADGSIDDKSFVQGIQYLIKEKIMKIPQTTQGVGSSNQIPTWIKNNAGWWADGSIDDKSFVQGIQYLIKEGIMKIER
ncbi:MAG: peptidase [Nitrosarchaeum sp.]|nr:peptidase [Nitrosarchaeum sp.]MBP0133593.1 peptidase [Nitrosarchaeum sp.]